MADLRFYRPLGPVAASELAGLTGSELRGDPDLQIRDVAGADRAGPEDLTFLADARLIEPMQAARPGAVLAPAKYVDRIAQACGAVLVNDRPRLALAQAAARLWVPIEPDYEGQEISSEASIDPTAHIGPGVVIAPGAEIGANTVLGPNVVVGHGVSIGADCRIGAGSHIEFSLIGDRARIGSNCVIGGTGFGVVGSPEGPLEIPHLGRVIVGNDVRFGSLCTIDRGMFYDTVVEDFVKLDNQCHIAHNCHVGRGALFAGMTGIGGSTTVGAGAMLGGRVGVADNIKIGEGAMVGAFSGVMRDIPAKERWVGAPCKPNRVFFREMSALARLAEKPRRDGSGDS